MAVEDRARTSPLPAVRKAPTSDPRGVIDWAYAQGLQIVDLKFIDLPGLWQHFSVPISELKEASSRTGWASTARPSGAGRRSTRATCSSCRIRRRPSSTRSARCRPCRLICDIVDPLTRKPYSRDPRNVARKAEAVPEDDRHRRHQLLGPGVRVLHLQRHPLPPGRPQRLLLHRLGRGHLEQRPGRRHHRQRQPGLPPPLQGGLLPRPADGQAAGPALAHDPEDDRGRDRHRGAAPRGGHRRPGRDRHALRHPASTWPTR